MSPIPTARIKSVAASGDDSALHVLWRDGERDTVNLAGWIATGGELLAPLLDPEIFRTATVIEHGTAIGWGDPDGDLAIDAFHARQLAAEQKPFESVNLAEWQRTNGLSNQEAKDFLGVSLSTFNAYKAGARIPAIVGMLCRASQRDPILMQAHFRPRKPGRPRRSPRAA